MNEKKTPVGVTCTCPKCKTVITVGISKKQAKALYKAYKGVLFEH